MLGGIRWLPTVSIIAVVLAQLWVLTHRAFVPLVDLPQHLALARILTTLGNADVAQLFEASLFPQVNILGLLIMAPLLALFPEPVVIAVVLAIYLTSLACALIYLATVLRATRMTAVFGLLFSMNFSVLFGFISFCLALPILIWIVARLAQTATAVRNRDVLVDAALWLLLALGHVILFVFALAAALLGFVFLRDRARSLAHRLLAVIPALALVLGWYQQTNLGVGGGVDVEWHRFGFKLGSAGWSLIVASVPGSVEKTVTITSVALVLFLLWREGGWKERRTTGVTTWVRCVALLAIVLYLFLPNAITDRRLVTQGVYLLYRRFLILAPLFVIPTLRWPRGALGVTVTGAVVALHLGLLVHWQGVFGNIASAARGLNEAVELIPPGQRLKSLIYTPYPSGLRYGTFFHAASYYQARTTGEVDQSFALLPTTPVHYRNPNKPHLSRRDENLAPTRFDWRRARLFDYILIYDQHGQYARYYSGVPYRRVFQENGWTLLKVGKRPDAPG
jgi:hypothetical protein